MRGKLLSGEPVSTRYIAANDPRSKEFAKPGQRLVWPGSFLFGYPREVSSALQPGPVALPPLPWMTNGSYLVFRRLAQDVSAFRAAVTRLEDHLRALGEAVPQDWVAARLVGRWPDGTPLHVSPTGPDQNVSGSPFRVNNFQFQAAQAATPLVNGSTPTTTLPPVPADIMGYNLPRMSHIRQVNPRDGRSEIGAEHHPSKLMLRRGITFGPEIEEEDAEQRGLLFLSYQTSIVEQFKFIQNSWANATARPVADGLDPIIGQDGTAQDRRWLRFFSPSRWQRTCPFDGRWVIATGGEYFFAPSLRGLRTLTASQQTT